MDADPAASQGFSQGLALTACSGSRQRAVVSQAGAKGTRGLPVSSP